MNRIICILYLVCLFFSCNRREGFLIEDTTIHIIEEDKLFADSVATSLVRLDFGKQLDRNQEVNISTSNGLLFKKPFGLDSVGQSKITITPLSESIEVLLLTNTLTIDEEVYISATINELTIDTVTAFLAALPEDFQIVNDKPRLKAQDSTEVIVKLYRSKGYTSNSLRFSLVSTLEQSDTSSIPLLVQIPEFMQSKNNELKIPINTINHSPGSRLTLTISSTLANGKLLEKSTKIYFD